MCEVVTARKQFAPTLVAPGTELKNNAAWNKAVDVAFAAEQNWALPSGQRKEIVPGASRFRRQRDRQPELAQCLPGSHDRRPHVLPRAEAAPARLVTARKARIGTRCVAADALPSRRATAIMRGLSIAELP